MPWMKVCFYESMIKSFLKNLQGKKLILSLTFSEIGLYSIMVVKTGHKNFLRQSLMRSTSREERIRLLILLSATCNSKFIQCYLIPPKLNAGCSGYLDEIHKILVEILDLKVCFPPANFFIWTNFFWLKTSKKVTNQWEFSNSFLLFNSVKIFLCVVYTYTRSKTIKYFFRHSDVTLLSGGLEYVNIQ